jgi:hypothetical protein
MKFFFSAVIFFFNFLSLSPGTGLDPVLDPDRYGIQPKMLDLDPDRDPDEMNADPQPYFLPASVYDPGCLSWIPNPEFFPSQIQRKEDEKNKLEIPSSLT